MLELSFNGMDIEQKRKGLFRFRFGETFEDDKKSRSQGKDEVIRFVLVKIMNKPKSESVYTSIRLN